MKVLGIAGSPRKGSTTEQLVREVLTGVECETEFVSLSGKGLACPHALDSFRPGIRWNRRHG